MKLKGSQTQRKYTKNLLALILHTNSDLIWPVNFVFFFTFYSFLFIFSLYYLDKRYNSINQLFIFLINFLIIYDILIYNSFKLLINLI